MNQQHIAIIGAGAWGTALAVLWAGAGKRVTLVARRPEHVALMLKTAENLDYLPDIPLPENLAITSHLEEADLWVMATPAQAMRSSVKQLPQSNTPLLICSKGIERESGLLMTEIAAELHPTSPIAILSGPNFAGEVARGLPTASVIACGDSRLRLHLAQWLSTSTFRLYHIDDIVGAEIAGALKNVLAIACGIAHGMGLGENARAALITRGLAEIKRLSLACGANAETLSGLSGLGDIVLSCSSPTSRNMSFGVSLGKGSSTETALASRKSVVEGVPTASAVLDLAQHYNIEMPICSVVNQVISGNINSQRALQILLDRPLKAE